MYILVRFKCIACGKIYTFENSVKKGPEFQVNLCAVLAGISTGIRFNTISDVFGLLNVKFMDDKKYKKVEGTLTQVLKLEAKKSMNRALEEEIKLTINVENFPFNK